MQRQNKKKLRIKLQLCKLQEIYRKSQGYALVPKTGANYNHEQLGPSNKGCAIARVGCLLLYPGC